MFFFKSSSFDKNNKLQTSLPLLHFVIDDDAARELLLGDFERKKMLRALLKQP